MSVLDTLNAASAATRDVEIIVDKALDAQWTALAQQLDEAAAKDADPDNGSLSMKNTVSVIDQMEEIREKVQASKVVFTFSQCEWHTYLALQAEHLPRKDSPVDRLYGYNVETFGPALIRSACTHVTGHDDPEPVPADQIPDDTWDRLLGSLNYRQFNLLLGGARAVNDQEAQVPPSARSLLGSQDTGASLAQPSPGRSPRAGSKDGSRPGSPKSSGTKKAKSSGS